MRNAKRSLTSGTVRRKSIVVKLVANEPAMKELVESIEVIDGVGGKIGELT